MIRTLSLAATATIFALPAIACEGFSAEDAYARFSTSMSQSGAAFMALHNDGAEDCQITGVRSTIAERTELHTHMIDANGVARMMEVEEGFTVPAGGEHLLERGADHVMLMGLTAPLAQGEEFEVTFLFADGSESVVSVTVDNERMPASGHGAMQGHGAGHSGHGTGHGAGHDSGH